MDDQAGDLPFFTGTNQDPLNALAERVFDSNAFDHAHRMMYVDIMLRMRDERRARPGFGCLHDLLIERAAFTFTLMKQREAQSDSNRIDWRSYERVNKVFYAAVDRLINEARLEDADEAARTDAVLRSLKVSLEAIDDLDIDDALKAAFADHLRTEANRLLEA